MSENSLATTARSLRDVITERIRASFVELIPEAEWTRLVQEEIDKFLKVRERGYRENRSFSDLQGLIQQELTERFTAEIKLLLMTSEYASFGFSGGLDSQMTPAKAIEEIIRQSAPDLVVAVFGSAVQQGINKLRSSF